MQQKLKLSVCTLLVSSLLVGLTWRPTVTPQVHAAPAPEVISTASVPAIPSSSFPSSSSCPSSSAASLAGESTSSNSLLEQKEVTLTHEEIKEAAHKTPTREEEREEDPQQNSRPKPAPPPIIDTITPPKPKPKPKPKPPKPESKPESKPSASSSQAESLPENSSQASSSQASSVPSQPEPSQPAPSPADGWYEKNGKTYYYYEGDPLTGWQVIGGRRYHFGSDGVLGTRTGIDVSTFQGAIDWNKVKADGIDYAMIRLGFRGYGTGKLMKDSRFEENYRNAKAAGMKIGVYFYSQAITRAEAVQEAEFVLEVLGGRHLDYPVAYDMEGWSNPDDDARCDDPSITNQDRTNFCIDFAETIRKGGYRPQIYTYYAYAYSKLIMNQLSGRYSIWIADYSSGITKFGYPYDVWQYTSSGVVDGIRSSVDMNVEFISGSPKQLALPLPTDTKDTAHRDETTSN